MTLTSAFPTMSTDIAIDRSPVSWGDFPARWRAAVGPQIAHVTRPAAFALSDGTLVVIVSGLSWLEDLRAMRTELLAKLPTSIDDAPLRRLALKLDPNDDPRDADR